MNTFDTSVHSEVNEDGTVDWLMLQRPALHTVTSLCSVQSPETFLTQTCKMATAEPVSTL